MLNTIADKGWRGLMEERGDFEPILWKAGAGNICEGSR
jgi:hypothetical protein